MRKILNTYSKEEQELLEKYMEFYNKPYGLFYEMRDGNVSKYFTNNDSIKTPLYYDMEPMFSLNHPNKVTKLIRENENDYISVFEGLIKTYPIDKLKDEYKRFYENNVDKELKNIKASEIIKVKDQNVKMSELSFTSKDNISLIFFMFPIRKDVDPEPLIKNMIDKFYWCGYNFSHHNKIQDTQINRKYRNDYDVYMIQFEAKYTESEPKLSDYLFHVSPSRYYDKIRKRGLVPTSKSVEFKYPERIYHFNKVDVEIIRKYGNKKVCDLRNTSNQKYVNDDGFFVFKINRDKLMNHPLYKNGKLVFYVDPCYSLEGILKSDCEAIFTYNNIPRELIEDDCMYFEVEK